MDLPPIPLIASTQMHNDTPEKVRFLEDVGFKRVILARELSLEEIAAIRQDNPHRAGVLCSRRSVRLLQRAVLYEPGRDRTQRKPRCLRPALPVPVHAHGRRRKDVLSDKFLLSLKDLNLMRDIPDLVAAGITSFKIEGRYKEIDYVKNVTAAYQPGTGCLHRGSPGLSPQQFRQERTRIFCRIRQKHLIEDLPDTSSPAGRRRSPPWIRRSPSANPSGPLPAWGKDFSEQIATDLQNGDGLCFFTKRETLAGFRVERVENSKIFPNTMKDLAEGIATVSQPQHRTDPHAAARFPVEGRSMWRWISIMTAILSASWPRTKTAIRRNRFSLCPMKSPEIRRWHGSRLKNTFQARGILRSK